jgi:heme/copper-type cytochrome/quinol oxidase subunit 2
MAEFKLLIVLAWIIAGLICAIVVAVCEIRNEARDGGRRDSDDMPPALLGIVMGVLVPIVIVVLMAIGFYKAFNSVATKLARVERLPEVKARKLREADKFMDNQ